MFNLRKKSVYREELSYISIPDDPTSLPFNNIFGDKWRVAIPIYNYKIEEIIQKLEKGEGKSKNKYRVDLVQQIVFRTVNTERGPKEIGSRAGKIIQKELGKEYADEWSRQMASANAGRDDSDYVIILSRHPIDVLRMSDHDIWTSCHGPGRKNETGVDRFHCAMEEANDGGPIAYAVNKNFYDEIKDELQNDEIFRDEERNTGTITPTSRIRVNRYTHLKDGYDLAIPIAHEYSEGNKKIAGFKETLNRWLKEKQKDVIGDASFTVQNFGRHGGSIREGSDGYNFNIFFGEASKFSGESQFVGEAIDYIDEDFKRREEDEEANIGHQLEELAEELEYPNRRADLKLEHTSLYAEPDVTDNGDVIPIVSYSIIFNFPNVDVSRLPITRYSIGGDQYIISNIARLNYLIEDNQENISKLGDPNNLTDDNKDLYNRYNQDLKYLKSLIGSVSEIVKMENILEELVNKNVSGSIDNVETSLEENNVLTFKVFIDNNPYDAGDYENIVNEAISFENENYEDIYKIIYVKLVKFQLYSYPTLHSDLENVTFKNINLEYDEETIEYKVNIEMETIAVPEQHKERIASELYRIVYNYAEQLYQQGQQNLLLPVQFTQIKREDIPEPHVELENIKTTKWIQDPNYATDRESWIFSKEIELPVQSSAFRIVFDFPIYPATERNSPAIIAFLRNLDKNYNFIVNKINQEIQNIISKYTASESAVASNWYKMIKSSYRRRICNWYKLAVRIYSET